MKTNEIMLKATSLLNKTKFQAQKHSPEILMVTGIVGGVTAAVLACRATLKLSPVVEEFTDRKAAIDICVSNSSIDYSEEEHKKDLVVTYGTAVGKVAKLYAPAVTVGVASVICILASNNILRKRNIALAAAYTTVVNAFDDYRKRVAERFGEEVEKEIRYNITHEEVEETETDKNGKEKTVKKTVPISNLPEGCSEYARFFDETSPYWKKDPEYNLMFVRKCQMMANDKLAKNGFLFLNEVYDMLGLEQSRAGAAVGWVYDPNNQKGDNYIDFGIYDINRKSSRNFVNGIERSVLLDFNCCDIQYIFD